MKCLCVKRCVCVRVCVWHICIPDIWYIKSCMCVCFFKSNIYLMHKQIQHARCFTECNKNYFFSFCISLMKMELNLQLNNKREFGRGRGRGRGRSSQKVAFGILNKHILLQQKLKQFTNDAATKFCVIKMHLMGCWGTLPSGGIFSVAQLKGIQETGKKNRSKNKQTKNNPQQLCDPTAAWGWGYSQR